MPDRAAQIAALSLPLDQLPDPLPIPTIERPFDVVIRPPGSKSITNRALLLAALADGTSELRGALIDADDAQVMLRAIQQLGAQIEIARSASGPDIVRITGVNGRWKIPAGRTVTLNLNNAGTATRFLTAAAILAPADSGGIIIDGDARMRERPIGELVGILRQMGVWIEHLQKEGFPPLRVHPHGDLNSLAHDVMVGTTASSQFISALMLVGTVLPLGIHVHFAGHVTSRAYVEMTGWIIHNLHAGPGTAFDDYGDEVQITPARTSPGGGLPATLPPFTLSVEPDASSASYFVAAAALFRESRVVIQGLRACTTGPRLQGDSMFLNVVEKMGAAGRSSDADMEATGRETLLPTVAHLGDMPDTAMTAAVLACFTSPTPGNPTATSILRGLRTLRVKETDRLEALRAELTKLGASIEIFRDGDDEGLRVSPPAHAPEGKPPVPLDSPVYFDTYHDHRMAMSLALIGLRRPNVFIRDPKCVAKTYPTFWRDLAKLYS